MTQQVSFKAQVDAIALALRFHKDADLNKIESRVAALWNKIQASDPDYARLAACRQQLIALRQRDLAVVSTGTEANQGVFSLILATLTFLLSTLFGCIFCRSGTAPVEKSAAPQTTTLPRSLVYLVGQRRTYENPAIPEYTFWKKILGDGNCFYTSYTVGYLNDFFHSDEKDTFIEIVRNQTVATCPAEKATVLRILAALRENPTNEHLFQIERNNKVMLQFVKFFRHAAASYLEQNRNDFLVQGDFPTYCAAVRRLGISTMGTDEVVALSNAMTRGPSIIQTNGTVVAESMIPFMSQGNTALLFTPSERGGETTGHYDILYRS